MHSRTLEDVTIEISRVLNGLEIDYVIVGGIAVASWGNLRTTRDVDIIISLERGEVKRFVDAIKAHDFLTSVWDIEAAMDEHSHFTISDKLSEYYIDAKGVYTDKEVESLKRKKVVYLGNTPIYIASPEDTLANKLMFGSEQDLKDAEGIWVRQMGKLDLRYLEGRCRALGVWEEFEEMKKRVGKYLKEIEEKEKKGKERKGKRLKGRNE
jgi:hypothetical protein